MQIASVNHEPIAKSKRIPKVEAPSSLLDPLIPTIFHEPWWLDAASNRHWEEYTVEENGKTVARFPYIVSKSYIGVRRSTMPELTHFLGPAVDAGTGNPVNRALKHYDRSKRVIEQACKLPGFWHKVHRGFGNAMPFQDLGCQVNVQFTYIIQPDTPDAIWKRMRDKTRNVIRRAEERWSVGTWNDPDAFADFYVRQIERRGVRNKYSKISAVCAATLARDQGTIFCARDEKGEPLAAVFIIWDKVHAYFHLTARAPDVDNGVTSMLIWNAIKQTTERGLIFDFDGVGTGGSRLFYNGFGGTVEPAYEVSYFREFPYKVEFRLSRALEKATGRADRAA